MSLVRSRIGTLSAPTALFALSGALVLLSGYVVSRYVSIRQCSGHYFGYTSWLSNWDGQWYQYIAHRGYHYAGDSGGYGPQNFFPLYPLLGRLIEAITPLYGQVPLIAVSWLAGLGFAFVWLRYARARIAAPPSAHGEWWGLALVLLWPVSYFLRVAYAESLYLLLLTLFFCGCAKRWNVAWLVLVTGLLSATRPTGVVACVALFVHLLVRYRDDPPAARIAASAGWAALSAWGLLAYMLYQAAAFDDPLTFLRKNAAWNYGMGADVFLVRWKEMLSLRPAWEFVADGSLLRPETYPWNLQNRALWLVGVTLLAIGCLKRWLNAEEAAFCALTLTLVYVTNGPKNMESVGRYVSTIVPLYLVMTRMLIALPVALRVAILAVSAVLLAYQTAQFSRWGCVF